MKAEHGRSMLPSKLMRPILLIPAFGLLLIVTIWAAALEQLSVDKRFILERATQDMQSAASTFEQDTLRIIKGADRWALRVKYEFESGSKVDLQALLSGSLLLPDEILSLLKPP